MAISLEGRVAIVTGGGRGLGRAHALELARRGSAVLVNDLGSDIAGEGRSSEPAEAVAEEIRQAGGRAAASPHDVSDPDEVEAMVGAAVAALGGLDILVNNAGNLFHHTVADHPLDRFDAILKVHLYGSFYASRAAAKIMRAGGWGRIVMTTSQVGFFGKAESGAYATAKMGILGLMATLNLETAPDNVYVNAVSPFAYTRMAEEAFPAALAPHLDPGQVAAAVTFLASDACTNGGNILVAGGGHFSAARMVESRGIDIEDPGDITAEAIAARWPEISDMAQAIAFPDAMAAVGATFAKIQAKAG
jgi:NAD(P)-dependent dehydrogenase (short-subunit alcohol dehydrogenase family)